MHRKSPYFLIMAVAGLMVLGLVMAQVEIHPVVQVLHLGLSGILLSLATLWFCGTSGQREQRA